MSAWPRIEEPELVERLSMGDAEFEAFIETLVSRFPRREYDAAALTRALGYPWERPDGPFRLTDGVAQPLDEMNEDERAAVEERFMSDPKRQPVLAFGANGSPQGLERKFAHFPDAEDRTALVLTGWLHDFDVGAAAQHTFYGAMPATIFPCPGTAVRAALVWVTSTQFTQLAWSELSYRLGRLSARFDLDGPHERVEEVLAFVSRFGALQLGDGGPIALAAIPAKSRTAEALTQEEVLDAVAELILGPGADAEALVRAAYENFAATAGKGNAVRSRSVPFASDRWTPYGRQMV